MLRQLERYADTNNVDVSRLAWLKWVQHDHEQQQADYATYRAYHSGQHEVPLSNRQKEYLALHDIEFRVNYLKLAVSVLVERYCVSGFDAGEAYGGKDGLLAQWWKLARMDGVQKALHKSAVVDGDSYLLCEWDNEENRPKWFHEKAYDGTEGVKVTYTDSSRRAPLLATKRWREAVPGKDSVMKMNIYTADMVYKYTADGSIASRFTYGWRLDDEIEWPLGKIPIVHFRYDDDGSNWGCSELEELIPIQQALNKAVLDVLDGNDNTAFQLITLSGGLLPDDFTLAPREALQHHDPLVKWGFIPAGDVEKLQKIKNDFIVTLAQVAQIPLNYFQVTGQVASSDTQGANDSGIVSKAESHAVSFGNSWEDAMQLAVDMHQAFGNGLADAGTISTQWASFERVDKMAKALQQSQIVRELVEAGVPLEIAMEVAGFSKEHIDAAVAGGGRLPEMPDGEDDE